MLRVITKYEISCFIGLNSFHLAKHNYQHKLNFIYGIAQSKSFNLNTIKKIYKRVRERIK